MKWFRFESWALALAVGMVVAFMGGCESSGSVRSILCDGFDGVCREPTECIPAISARDCEAVREAMMEHITPRFEACVRECPIKLRCPTVSDTEAGRDCDCTADCVEGEAQEFQDAYLAYIECEVPPECR